MGETAEPSLSLEQTPTYAAATVIFIFVSVSYLLERGLHYLGKWLRNNSKPLNDALEIMKEELMLVGFISILIALFQKKFHKICVPTPTNMLPCPFAPASETRYSSSTGYYPPPSQETQHRRLLLSYNVQAPVFQTLRRSLASGSSENPCSEGKSPFISVEGVHELHIFIFMLAVIHIFYSCVTLLLALYKIHRWKTWEGEAQQMATKCLSLSPEERIRLMKTTRKSTFVRRHEPVVQAVHITAVRKGLSFAGINLHWLKDFEKKASIFMTSFFSQFWNSVGKSEYLTLRMAFITNHNAKLDFDFHSYLMKTMEIDISYVIGTNFSLWIWVVIVFALNVNGWNILFWVDFIPVILALLVGTKLEYIVSTLAQETGDQPALCMGQNIRARDELFWFKNPKLLLYILHFIIFQNSFELAMIFWYMINFGKSSCLIGNWGFVITRLCISLFVQLLCSYIILPLYCLVTQLGSHFKASIFSDQVTEKLSAWAKRHKKQNNSTTFPQPLVDAASMIHSTVSEGASQLKNVVIGAVSEIQERKDEIPDEGIISHETSAESLLNQEIEEHVAPLNGVSSEITLEVEDGESKAVQQTNGSLKL